jgi:hypothetical protein
MNFRTIQLTTELPANVTKGFQEKLLDGRDYDFCVDENALVLKPNGEPLLKLVKSTLPLSVCELAWKNFRRVAKSPIIGGSRGTAAGTALKPARKQDGTLGAMYGVPDLPRLRDSSSGVIGFLDRSVRDPYCRQTAFGPNHPLVLAGLPFVRAVDAVFREHMPDRYCAQMQCVTATAPEFVIRGTAFTTITVNRNWQTAAHADKGDLREGFGVLTCLCAGNFNGGELVFPKYRVAVQFRSQDVLLADVHELHGNAPILGTPGEYERVSCVFYYRRNMIHCGSAADELAFARSRRLGDSLYPDQASRPPHVISQSAEPSLALEVEAQPTPNPLDGANTAKKDFVADTESLGNAVPLQELELRVATLEDREKLESWCSGPTCPKIGREFPFMWRRYHNWTSERNRPTIAWIGDRIIGFHATSYMKFGYCNLLYVAVDIQAKRMGVGKKLIENSLQRGHALGMTRWTNKSHKGSDGESFFSRHLGIYPVAQKGNEVIYDWSIKDIHTCDEIKARVESDLYRLDEIPARKLSTYAKAVRESGLELLLQVPNIPDSRNFKE